eukprot:scaffold247553_cov33-Prasinocladus_malaysianus.AAC.1
MKGDQRRRSSSPAMYNVIDCNYILTNDSVAFTRQITNVLHSSKHTGNEITIRMLFVSGTLNDIMYGLKT